MKSRKFYAAAIAAVLSVGSVSTGVLVNNAIVMASASEAIADGGTASAADGGSVTVAADCVSFSLTITGIPADLTPTTENVDPTDPNQIGGITADFKYGTNSLTGTVDTSALAAGESMEVAVTYKTFDSEVKTNTVTVTVTKAAGSESSSSSSSSSESSSSSSSSSESSSSSSSSSESSSSSSSSSESSSSSSSSSESSSSSSSSSESSSSSSTSSDTPSESTSTSAPSGGGTVTIGGGSSTGTSSTTSSDTTSAPTVALPEQTEAFVAEKTIDEAFTEEEVAIVEKIEFFTPADTFPEGTVPSIKPAANVAADNAFALDITFELDGTAVQPKDGAAVTVAVPVPAMFANVDQSTLKVFYFDGTNYTAVAGAKVADGMVKFTTNHFSTYVISTENLAEKNTPATADKNPITGVAALAALPVVALAGAVIIVAKKRK